mmetsp:Transcript_804/g.1137  ORF Transcript_804/g.1137 Transcript_804/m.1137 type:complete len:89 (+) Transcript_804:75-341(+)
MCCPHIQSYTLYAWSLKQKMYRRFFLYTTVARKLGVTGFGHRARHTACVTERISELFGASLVGLLPLPVCVCTFAVAFQEWDGLHVCM